MAEDAFVISDFLPEDLDTAEKAVSYYENKYELVTRVAFLCGVPDRFIDGSCADFLGHVAEQLRKNDRALIIRNLCLLRNSIEHNYKKINDAMYKEGRPFYALSEYYPEEALTFLYSKGIKLPDQGNQLHEVLCEINRLINDRINNCKDILPGWIRWDYIREMFIMPNGQKKIGTQEAANMFYENMAFYPFGVYINWIPHDVGNLFANDYKFATTLYGWHGERFLDLSNLSDVSLEVKGRIYDFLNQSTSTILVVDCENSDPYSLCAMFNCIDDEQADKITKIILYDDPQAPTGWKFFEQHVNIQCDKIEHIVIKRILDYKSLLDVKLSARIMKEFYSNNVESFVLVSSDSDFWGLMEELPQAHFLVMLEHRKTSSELKSVLDEHNIFYCYTDDFYTGMDDTLKKQAMFAEFNAYFEDIVFNISDVFEDVLRKTRVELPDGEKKQFYEKYLKTLQLKVENDGEVHIEIKK